MLDHGFYEVINAPFVSNSSGKSIKVDNPLDSNKKYLRTNLIDSLINNLIFNERRQKDSIKLFEISDVYNSQDGQISKTRKVALIASGRAGKSYKDFSKKINKKYLSDLFHEALPNQAFDFEEIDRSELKTKIKSEIIGCEMNVSSFSKEILKYSEEIEPLKNFIQYSPISELPLSKRDLSFSIKDFSKFEDLQEYILNFEHKLLKEIFVFDYFYNEKNAEIKIGFRFIFQSTESTITESQVNEIINDIIVHTKKIEGIIIPGLS